jgi:hypothetical protein
MDGSARGGFLQVLREHRKGESSEEDHLEWCVGQADVVALCVMCDTGS